MSGLICWRNWADTATVTPVYQALTATIDAAFPLSNLKTRQLSSVCRYTTGGYVVASADLGQVRNVKLCAVLGLRARRFDPGSGSSNAFYFKVRVSNLSDFSVLLYDVQVQSTLNPLIDMPANVHHILPDGISGRYVQIRVDYAPPLGETFREAGRLWIGDALSMPGVGNAGVQAQWQMGVIDAGGLDASEGGQHYCAVGVKTRRVGLDVLCNDVGAYGFTDADVIQDGVPCLQALQIEAGTTGEVIVLPRITTPLWIQAVNVYGHVERPFDIQHLAGPKFRASLSFVEER